MRKAVVKVENEKSQGPSIVLRQFSKRVSSSGILRNARAGRYHTRTQSKLAKKQAALKRIEKRKLIQKLLKLGRPLPERGRRR